MHGGKEMGKNNEHTLKVIRVGNSIGVILPKKEFEFRDLEPYRDWVKITIKEVVR